MSIVLLLIAWIKKFWHSPSCACRTENYLVASSEKVTGSSHCFSQLRSPTHANQAYTKSQTIHPFPPSTSLSFKLEFSSLHPRGHGPATVRALFCVLSWGSVGKGTRKNLFFPSGTLPALKNAEKSLPEPGRLGPCPRLSLPLSWPWGY
jgi:hypothetical protein